MTVYQYTQGSSIFLTIVTTNGNNNPIAPQNFQPPTVNLYYINNLNVQVPILENLQTIPVTNTFYYAVIDTISLATGNYIATSTWYFNNTPISFSTNIQILPYNGLASSILPQYDPITRLRIRLKDYDHNFANRIWSDFDLNEFLVSALQNINAQPPLSGYTFFNIPNQWSNPVLQYAEALALRQQGILKLSEYVDYSDRNITLRVSNQSKDYLTQAELMEKMALDQAKLLKRQVVTGRMVLTPSVASLLSLPPARGLAYGFNFI